MKGSFLTQQLLVFLKLCFHKAIWQFQKFFGSIQHFDNYSFSLFHLFISMFISILVSTIVLSLIFLNSTRSSIQLIFSLLSSSLSPFPKHLSSSFPPLLYSHIHYPFHSSSLFFSLLFSSLRAAITWYRHLEIPASKFGIWERVVCSSHCRFAEWIPALHLSLQI